MIFLERLQTSTTTTCWRLTNTSFCQNVAPMGTTFWQTVVLLQTSNTTTLWRLQNTYFCQNVVPMGTPFWQQVVFWSLQQVVVFEVWSLSRKIWKISEKNGILYHVLPGQYRWLQKKALARASWALVASRWALPARRPQPWSRDRLECSRLGSVQNTQ